ncbi:MAG: SdiA-regulated domain-containing protein [Prolixibacteraceae bacterium]|nr:SdiA-regulated domain-containing protein [Prolixibacteraceae bacterium]MBN2773007.1 SdiA-regulated domain-containing protein [Prolixibacteraceae bacterium]
MKFVFIAFTVFFLTLNVNAQFSENFLFKSESYSFPYNLKKADVKYNLSGRLTEVSGLSFYKENLLTLVQDEKGNVYFFDTEKEKITDKIDFANDGDYEGVEVVGDEIWVLKSNGILFRIKNPEKEKSLDVKDYDTDLNKRNDTEGLAFDRKNNRLLVACKGFPFINSEKGEGIRAVYSFDLDKKKLSDKPVIEIDIEKIKELRKLNVAAKLGIKLLKLFNPSKGDITFQPSGIAIHPETGNIYILASTGNLLLVCDEKGNFLAVVKLNSGLFNQPEGICFDPDGNLYISNEGEEFAATLLKFKPKNKTR